MESLFEAFNDLADIDDGMLNVSINDVEKIKAFKDGDDVAIEYQKIIDPLAKDEEEVRGDYLGKKILKCCVCHSLVYKDEDEITFNEDETVANEGEECPMCFSTEGFKVVGEVSPFKDVTVEEDDERFELVKDITDLLTKFYRKSSEVEFEPLFKLETNGTLDLEKVREKLDEEPGAIRSELLGIVGAIEEGKVSNVEEPEFVRELIKKVSELIPEEEEKVKDSIEIETTGEAGFKAAEKAMDTFENETELEESYTKKSHKEKSGKVIEESFKNEFERLEKVLKELNWSVEDIGDEYEIETWSPLGEDLIEYLDKKDIVESVRIIYDNYDVDEHAEPFIEMRGTRGVPNSIQDLIEDAEDIQEMYKELKEAIEKEFSKDELEESTERDDIDADADDKKERIRKALKRRLDDADSLRDERRKSAKAKFRKAQDDIDADRDDKLERKGLKESKQLNEGYRGCKKVEMIWHGAYSDPELYYKDDDGTEYYANYWDVEDSMWNYYKEQAQEAKKYPDRFLNTPYDWSSVDSNDDTDFNKFIVNNENSVISDVIDFSEYNEYDDELDESVTPRDDIDAKADNRKELAKKRFMRAKDDADADKDHRLKKAGLKEARKEKYREIQPYFNVELEDDETEEGGVSFAGETLLDFLIDLGDEEITTIEEVNKVLKYNGIKPIKVESKLEESDKPAATSIEDAQKWVDYDMKKYGRISRETNRLVRRAGFQIIKDQYGDYEVTARDYERPEEENEETKEESLKEDTNNKLIKFRVNWLTKYIMRKGDPSSREMQNTYVIARNANEAIEKVKNDNEKLWAMCNAVYIAEGPEMGLEVNFDDKYSKDYSGGQSIDLTEDTIKQNGKWVNKGEEGTHGKFKTKKAADEQRRAIWVNWDK